MTSRRTLLAVGVGAILGIALCVGSLQAKRTDSDDELYKQLELFTDAVSLIQADYVEQPPPKQLVYGALKGMLSTLDPYSQFLDPDSYNELKIDTEGQFGGLGIEITLKDEMLTVITPIDDTPAFKAGLKPGDRIVKINNELTRGITLMDAVKKLRGAPGTPVSLVVLREGENQLREFTVTRDIIKIKSIREAKFLEPGIGYIRVTDFRESTPDDIKQALDTLKGKPMDGIIIDLRNNPGGLLDVTVEVAELFLQRNDLIVSTKGRLKNQNLEFHSRGEDVTAGVPMVVLINEGSASASEIFAGAMQDHKRGILLGTKSHGKASVQTIFPMKDGSALKLTTSKYFTPAGRMIHGQGIVPDVVVPFEAPPEPTKEEQAAADKDKDKPKSDEIFDAIEHPDEPAKKAAALDNQLSRAIDLLKGIKVYQSSRKTSSSLLSRHQAPAMREAHR